MLKCLMLQGWCNLSDPGLEEALRDRISFLRTKSAVAGRIESGRATQLGPSLPCP
jgi:hypothetical protein